jgi:hypothetical protein
MNKRIAHLIKEHKNRSKLFNTRDPDIEVARRLNDPQNIDVPVPDKEEESTSNLRKESQHRKLTMPKEDKN